MTHKELRDILKDAHTIAVVGLSADETKDSHEVAAYLQQAGYHIVPVNPKADTIIGEKVYRSLLEIPRPPAIDVVQIFRPSAEVPAIVDQAIQIGAKVVWMQLGIINAEAALKAHTAGLQVVMNHCMMQEHHRLLSRPSTV